MFGGGYFGATYFGGQVTVAAGPTKIGSSSTTSGSSGAITATLPQSATANNLLLLIVTTKGFGGFGSCTTPTGWTLVNTFAESSTGANTARTYLFYKVAAGSDSNPSFTTGAQTTTAVTEEWSGLATTSVLRTSGVETDGAASSDSVTLSSAASGDFVYCASGNQAGTPTWGGGVSIDINTNLNSALVTTATGTAGGSITPTLSWSSNTTPAYMIAAAFVPAPIASGASRTVTVTTSAAGSATTTTAYVNAVLADSPLGYWHCDEVSGTTLTDSSGSSRTATFGGSGVTYGGSPASSPIGGTSIALTGSGSFATASAAAWMNGLTAFSAETWFKTTDSTTNVRGLMGRDETTNPRQLQVRLQTGQIQFIVFDPAENANTIVSPTSGYNDGNWHHMVVTAANSGSNVVQVLYVDGSQIATTTWVGHQLNNGAGTTGFEIGGVRAVGWNGSMDEVAVYGTALTATQVTNHWNASLGPNSNGSASQAVTATSSAAGSVAGSASLTATAATSSNGTVRTYSTKVLADSPLAYWRLDEASGTAMADSSGNAHGGTYSGATLGQSGLFTGSGTAALGGGSGQGIGSITSAAWMNAASFTVEFWVKPNNTNDIAGLIGRYVSFSGSYNWLFWQRTGLLSFLVQDSGSGDHNLAGPSFSAGTVYYLVGTYDGTTQKLYVNGSLFASQAVSLTGTNSNDMQIGGYGGANLSQATIDEVAFYGSALTATQIADHWNAAQGIVTSTASTAVTAATSATGSVGLSGTASLGLTVTTSADTSGRTGLSVTVGTAASATMDAVGTASLTITATTAASAGGANRDVTVTTTAAGRAAYQGQASATVNVTRSATLNIGYRIGASAPLTVSTTGTGVVGKRGAVALSVTAATTVTVVIGTSGPANRPVTVASAASGKRTYPRGGWGITL